MAGNSVFRPGRWDMRRDRTMGKMMASLAHQIRTPLASSVLYLSQCVDGKLDQETSRAFCEKALARNQHIEKLINDMLVFAHGGQFAFLGQRVDRRTL
jgi:two-component system sensor histidine kinase FlrB